MRQNDDRKSGKWRIPVHQLRRVNNDLLNPSVDQRLVQRPPDILLLPFACLSMGKPSERLLRLPSCRLRVLRPLLLQHAIDREDLRR